MADLPKIPPEDPRNCLSVPARRRVSNAHLDADLIRTRALEAIYTRYDSEPAPRKTFSEYVSAGQAAIKITEAAMQAARAVLHVLRDEYRAAGKSDDELRETMWEEVDSVVTSFELTTPHRDLLWRELGLYRYAGGEPDSQATASGGSGMADAPSRGESTGADLAQQGDKAVEAAIRLFESHRDFLRLQVRMRERMAEAARNSPADARYHGTVARLQYVLTLFAIRAETFWKMVSDIQWQNAFIVMLESFERVAWEEHTGQPVEVLRPASAQANANFEAIHAKVQEWTQKGYKRLVSSPDETTRTDAGRAVKWTNGHEPAAPQPAADAFATRDQREAAIKRAAEKFGTVAEIATCFKVDYRDLRKWARDRDSLAKGLSLKAKRIEDGLLPYCPE
jgi:hypothetical protein